jgi:hypothetical protein
MWTLITILSLLAAAVMITALVMGGRRTPRGDVDVVDPADAGDFPDLGEPSPRRSDGRPVPGSREDRQRHGKP